MINRTEGYIQSEDIATPSIAWRNSLSIKRAHPLVIITDAFAAAVVTLRATAEAVIIPEMDWLRPHGILSA